MILATLVAVEHIYIMCLETIFTKSRTTARTFNMDVEELSRPSVSTLFKNQGVYNLLLAVFLAKIETSLVFDFAFKGAFLVLWLCSAIFVFMAS